MTSVRAGLQTSYFYRNRYRSIMLALFLAIVILLLMISFVLYQISHRPLPEFYAVTPSGKQIVLISFDEPNLYAPTLIKWASKAAVSAYTFDFANYETQLVAARPYFTAEGWSDFRTSIADVIQSVVQAQLFVNGVVSGPPVISNQGELPGRGYVWRVQIPFLVTFQSANSLSRKGYTVIVNIVKVPTTINPKAIGIDQFVMG